VGVIKPISRASADKSAVVAAAARPSADSVNNKSAVVAASARPSADHVSNKVTLRSTADTNKHQEEKKATKTTSFAKKQDNRAASPTTTLNNLINLTNNGSSKSNNKSETKKENNKNQSNKKEVIVIDKKTELEPILKAPTQSHNTSKVANNHHTNKIVTFAEEIQIEHENQENKKSDNERLIHTPSPIKDNSDEGIDNLMLEEFDPETMDKSNYRDSWKKRQEAETKNTMVFNFLNSQKDVTHIENDGLDLSKRKKKQHMQQWSKESGVIALSKKNGNLDQDDFDEGVDDEVESDSDSGLGGSVPPCSVTFVGANVQTGKSSLRSKSKDIKRNITFSKSLTEVFEYPSFETATEEDNLNTKSGITTNKNPIGSFGGLGSYTPSKMGDNSFQLGVSRTVPHASSIKPSADTKQRPSTQNGVKSQSGATVESGVEEVLRPTEDAISWSGSSSSSDMLF